MRNARPSELGELEQQVMELVWRFGPCSAEAIREKLDRPLKDSTVRTVLRRLEEKRMVRHQADNRTFIYQATEAKQQAAAKAVKQIMDSLCEGSIEKLLTGLVDYSVVDRHELKRLAKRIAKAND